MTRLAVIAVALTGCFGTPDAPIDSVDEIVDGFEDLTLSTSPAVGRVIALDGARAVALADDGVDVLELADPAAPTSILRVEGVPADATCAIDGDRVYVLVPTDGGVTLDDLAGHQALLPDVAAPFAVADEVVYGAATDGTGAIRIFDLRGLADAPPGDVAITAAASVRVESGTKAALAVHDGQLFVADGAAGVLVLDLADPMAPALVHRLGLGGAEALAFDGDVVVAAGNRHVELYELGGPRVLGGVAANTGGRVVARDGYLYLTMVDEGPERPALVTIVDATDPEAPVVVRTKAIAAGLPHVTVIDDLLVLGGPDGLAVYTGNRP